MKLGCVIMASGEGKRFGSNKMFADICGKPLIQRTIESVPKGFDVVVTTRWPQVADICRELRCACALHDGALRSESVRAGLAWGADRGWRAVSFCRATSRSWVRIPLKHSPVLLRPTAALRPCVLP